MPCEECHGRNVVDEITHDKIPEGSALAKLLRDHWACEAEERAEASMRARGIQW